MMNDLLERVEQAQQRLQELLTAAESGQRAPSAESVRAQLDALQKVADQARAVLDVLTGPDAQLRERLPGDVELTPQQLGHFEDRLAEGLQRLSTMVAEHDGLAERKDKLAGLDPLGKPRPAWDGHHTVLDFAVMEALSGHTLAARSSPLTKVSARINQVLEDLVRVGAISDDPEVMVGDPRVQTLLAIDEQARNLQAEAIRVRGVQREAEYARRRGRRPRRRGPAAVRGYR
jgi:hypothetical protein